MFTDGTLKSSFVFYFDQVKLTHILLVFFLANDNSKIIGGFFVCLFTYQWMHQTEKCEPTRANKKGLYKMSMSTTSPQRTSRTKKSNWCVFFQHK